MIWQPASEGRRSKTWAAVAEEAGDVGQSTRARANGRWRAPRGGGGRAHLDGRVGAVEVPVEDGRLGDDAERLLAEPLPEDDLLVHQVGLELLLCRDVEHLELPAGLEREDLVGRVHDGAVGRDRPADDGIGVVEVDDDNVGLVAHADERVGLERERLERDGRRLDAERRELRRGRPGQAGERWTTTPTRRRRAKRVGKARGGSRGRSERIRGSGQSSLLCLFFRAVQARGAKGGCGVRRTDLEMLSEGCEEGQKEGSTIARVSERPPSQNGGRRARARAWAAREARSGPKRRTD